MSDHLRELHQIDPGEDLPSDAECILDIQETISQLEAGELAAVPPWMTLAEALEQAREELARLRARTV